MQSNGIAAFVTGLFLNTPPPTMFREEFTFAQRLAETRKQLDKYPNRIPIVIEDDKRTPLVRIADRKRKFLVPREFTFGELMFVIRKRAKIEPHQALILFVDQQGNCYGNSNSNSNSNSNGNNGGRMLILPPTSMTIGNIYRLHRDPDNFVYLKCTTENVFG